MKKCILVIMIFSVYTVLYAQQQNMQVTYNCPMHPEIHSVKPGNCAKCGMELVKEKSAKEDIYNCPMHPEVKSDKQGKCPKCGMDLVKMNNNAGNHNHDMAGMDMPMAKYVSLPDKYKIDNNKPKVTHYDLFIGDTMVNFSGKLKRAIAVNGQIPMPTLTFLEGDTAEVVVHNLLNEPTSLHWHGLFVPNQYDGVSYLTQKPIQPGETYLYRFPIKQSGTHWYHSHFELQEQIGMYGSMTLLSRKELDIPSIPVVLSEWSDVKPKEIHRRLYTASDWFGIQKKTTQSYSQAIGSGHLGTKIRNEWKRMNAMDVTDVYYDKFLINGKTSLEYSSPLSFTEGLGVRPFKAGDKVRLRIANGGASDYFWLTYAGGKITVVANDGNDVVPIEVDRLIIGVSETYDVVVTIPENKQYEFLVTPEDRTKYASLWLGSGDKVPAKKMERLKYFEGMKMMNNMMDNHGNVIEMKGMVMQNQVMDMNTVMYPEITGPATKQKQESMMMNMLEQSYAAHKKKEVVLMDDSMMMGNMNHENMQKDNMQNMDHGNMKAMDHSTMMMMGVDPLMDLDAEKSGIVTLSYSMLRSLEKTTLPDAPMRTLRFDLTGNMDRYVWTLDNKTISESDMILIKSGENLRITLFNNSMMRHPMHLHGHDFRVLNGMGNYAPLKNVLDIMPMERDTIEWAANADGGDWFFHCHILYHMMSGMGRVFGYEGGTANPEIVANPKMYNKLRKDDSRFHLMANAGVQTNGSDGNVMLMNKRWQANSMWHLGYHVMHGYESETMIGRYLGRMQWWFPYVGFDYHYKTEGVFQKGFFDLEGSVKNIFGSEEKNWFGQMSNKNTRHTVVAGIAYKLPMLFIADFRVDGDGKFRFQFSREDVPVTSRLRFSMMINTDKEYMAGFKYIATKYISIGTHYDSDMGIGAGIIFTY